MKQGDVRYEADICYETGKIEINELCLRSIQKRKNYLGMNLNYDGDPFVVCYWIVKINHLTWVKLSKKKFDWGWSKSIPDYCRRTCLFTSDPPGCSSKKKSLQKLLRELIKWQKKYGNDTGMQWSYSMLINKVNGHLARHY